MNTQIKNYLKKLLLTIVTAVGILTGTAAAQQMPNRSDDNRERFAAQMRRHAAQAQSLAGKSGDARAGAINLTDTDTFENGKDFTLAGFDAEGMDTDPESINYTILDLVYLIDRLEGQPETVQLQKILKSVLRATSSGALVKKDIQTVSKAYLNRQKAVGKWYFNAGQTSMNLMISTYMGEDANIKTGLAQMQALIKTAPKGTAKELLDPMNALARYAALETFADEDYTAIYAGVGSVIDAASA